ncbi:hypothetical protein BaRGS_00006453 [Batillaria attramentaria]|uniref:Uncharacterized protein n=1 Tax=Batillaria attramentaria TaxID=370345 RepID=A0ABD0LT57_9CAEN
MLTEQQCRQDSNADGTAMPTGQQCRRDSNADRIAMPTGQQCRRDSNADRTAMPKAEIGTRAIVPPYNAYVTLCSPVTVEPTAVKLNNTGSQESVSVLSTMLSPKPKASEYHNPRLTYCSTCWSKDSGRGKDGFKSEMPSLD